MTSKITYTGGLRTAAIHLSSEAQVYTDAPRDNQGNGAHFSPTDLTATSLASCMLTIIGIAAKTHGFSIDGTTAAVTKIMKADPRRIGEIVVDIQVHGQEYYTEKEQKIIELAGRTCPVAMSMHPDIFQNITFHWS